MIQAMRLATASLLFAGVSVACAQEPSKSADAIVAQIEAIQVPQPDRARLQEPGYRQEYIALRQQAAVKKAELIGELFKAAPEHERLAQLLPERWMALMSSGEDKRPLVEGEVEAALAKKGSPLHKEAAYFNALLIMNGEEAGDRLLPAVEEFIAAAPGDERGGMLLFQSVAYALEDLSTDQKKALYERVAKDYAGGRPAEMAQQALEKLAKIGKPFDLTFNEAITGKSITMADLKGKVVVIDFWATWCGPCVAEMPTMKKLYAELKPQGVEFIGVSLDEPEAEGGLQKLKDFVAENEITWPQFYQGNGWESEFSMSWGINAIPAVFVVDQQGKLYSTDARGKLDKLVPELLKKGGEAGEE